jgi:NADH-quinone oxidoreductase subunit M
VDGISLFFILLTTLLTPVCVIASEVNIGVMKKEYYALFLIIEAMVITVFEVTDRLMFYVSFEAVLIPMFIRIGV